MAGKTLSVAVLLLFLALAVRAPHLWNKMTADDTWTASGVLNLSRGITIEDGLTKQLAFWYGTPESPATQSRFFLMQNHPPLYLYNYLPFVEALGHNEFALRLPALLAGLAALLVTYLTAKKFIGKETAALSLALGVFSAYHAFHNSLVIEVSGSFAGLAFAAATYYFLKAEKGGKLADYAAAGAVLLFGVLTYMITVVLWFGMVALLALQRKWKEAGVVFSIVFVGYAALALGYIAFLDSEYLLKIFYNPVSFSAIASGAPLSERLTGIIAGNALLLQQLSPALASILFLAVAQAAWNAVSKRKFDLGLTEHKVLALFLLLTGVVALAGGMAKDRYFAPSLYLSFLVAGTWLSSTVKAWVEKDWKLATASAAAAFAALAATGYHEYFYYEYALYGSNALSFAAFALPLIPLTAAVFLPRHRRTSAVVLLGLFLGAGLYHVAFNETKWQIAISRAVDFGLASNATFFASKSSYMLHSIAYYDYYKDGRERIENSYVLASLAQ
ncbi:MAG TPA: glycosyltransferase family 39 protein, partial [archaeon]|nr:glycosyltransferase family 39 protein [archaeon]